MAKSKQKKLKCVYFLLLNGDEPKGYVGSTQDLKSRFKAYKYNSNKMVIENYIQKYGWDNFDKLIIPIECETKEQLLKWESFYISLFGTYYNENPDFGLNKVREPHKGSSSEQSTKESISKSTKGKVNIGVKRPYLSERNKIIKPALGRTGEKHPMSKKILYVPDNILFNSIKECGDYFGVSRQAIKSRIKYARETYKLI